MIKVLPISNCLECPKLDKNNKACELSKAQAYDLDDDWEEYLEQFCPLEYLETIINDAYEKGMNYKKFKDKTEKNVKESIKENRWATAHEYLEKIKG